jgi:hypothetical protein
MVLRSPRSGEEISVEASARRDAVLGERLSNARDCHPVDILALPKSPPSPSSFGSPATIWTEGRASHGPGAGLELRDLSLRLCSWRSSDGVRSGGKRRLGCFAARGAPLALRSSESPETIEAKAGVSCWEGGVDEARFRSVSGCTSPARDLNLRRRVLVRSIVIVRFAREWFLCI